MADSIDTLRHEYKYHISQGAYALLSRTLSSLMWRDDNADENGEYYIRSLYFDDPYSAALGDKLTGIQARDKYRLRVYDYSDKVIRLERKSKRGDFIHKEAALITRGMCDKLRAGDASGLEGVAHPLIQDMFRMMRTRLLRPSVYVDYIREAYVHPAENVRVTFDKHIRAARPEGDMFDRRLPVLPVMDNTTVVLEVKYDNRLPEHIRQLISQIPANPSAISKYVLCRRFY